jgi:hypothetical protein
MGRPKGSKNRKKFSLTAERVDDAKKPTAAQRMQILQRQVVLMVADDQSPETIAAVMQIPVDRLKVVFAHQLEFGKAIVRAEELLRLDAQSESGKTAATKLMLETASGAQKPAANTQAEKAKANQKTIVDGALKLISGGRK